MSSKDAIVRVLGLRKEYVMGHKVVEVLKDIDLELREAEITAMVGPSGAGKSTFVHILGALDRPTAGSVHFRGKSVFESSDHDLARFRCRSIGFVFQFHHLMPDFTALENVIIPGMIARRPVAEVRERAFELLDRVGLSERVDHRPSELSGGEQQRVAVARALVNDPPLILADEPSGNLDARNSEALHALLWELSRSDRRTFLIVTHNHELAAAADGVVELCDGQIRSAT